ncbi:sialate O-acetylesterase [Thunnus albacares]|uniref:sialate O-acetylesterase n=1 Tax=Thunnus albacares TaxID=8236 RepID=UPI001CF69D14|nr:sialate O-acetylesterase [Thunnus albacares]
MAITLCAVFLLIASIHACDGQLSFASYYGDHMVLKKSPEKAVLWGYGPEGEEVILFLLGPVNQKTSATVTKGIWRVTLDPVEAGGPYNVSAFIGNSTATLTDVLFGDVWLCGGQSNMLFEVSQLLNKSEELAIADKYPHVRTFMVALNRSDTELNDLIEVKFPWSVPTANNLPGFSAVCWLFGRYLYDYLKYPIGLVESCWGGTPIEAWSSSRALQYCGLMPTETNMFPPLTHLEDNSVMWNSTRMFPPLTHFENNSVMWNSMIHPLLNMTIKGAIWYQGEANTVYHEDQYNCSFPAMIDDWRMAFHKGSGGQTAIDFPFGFVQLSTNQKSAIYDGFPDIRWHQTADTGFAPNFRMKRTFMAVAMDLPDEKSPYGTIHPRDKYDVAYRLTLGAKAVAYNDKDVSFLGPFPSQIMSSKMFVSITYNQTVFVKPSKDIFEICCSESLAPCGPKSNWVPAPIILWDHTTVELAAIYCPHTDEVVALRYAWRDWPCDFKACPIYSATSYLPAPPFVINRKTAKGTIWKRH